MPEVDELIKQREADKAYIAELEASLSRLANDHLRADTLAMQLARETKRANSASSLHTRLLATNRHLANSNLAAWSITLAIVAVLIGNILLDHVF